MSVATEFAPSVVIPARAYPSLVPAVPAVPARGPARPHERAPGEAATVTVLHAPPRVAPPVRLTHRGVAVVALAVAALGTLLVWLAALSAPAAAPSAPAPRVVTVRSGDTLWSIASRVAPQGDPRAELAMLQRVNHLSGVDLTPGQQLRTH